MPVVDTTATFAAVLAGDFDAQGEAEALDGPAESESAAAPQAAATIEVQAPERRVLAAEPDAPKLHKLLAQSGIGSRRDME